MTFEGKFKSIDNKFIYYLKIGNGIGTTRQIQDGDIDAYNDGEILCFAGDSPITIQSDTSDTFENVYVRSATVTLVANYDIRKYVVAENYIDIPIIIKKAEGGYNDNDNERGCCIKPLFCNTNSYDLARLTHTHLHACKFLRVSLLSGFTKNKGFCQSDVRLCRSPFLLKN